MLNKSKFNYIKEKNNQLLQPEYSLALCNKSA